MTGINKYGELVLGLDLHIIEGNGAVVPELLGVLEVWDVLVVGTGGEGYGDSEEDY